MSAADRTAHGVGDTAGAAGAAGDPVLVRRRQAARMARLGQRFGYATFGVALVAFVIGFATRFSGTVAVVVTAALIVGSLFLAPAIVVGYAVKAAEREDRDRAAGRLTR
jgi:hypothetical protein